MPKVEVSVGELIDKITILEIKQERIEDRAKLAHVSAELDILKDTLEQEAILVPEDLIEALKTSNTELWEAEDVIRDCEKAGDFSESFIECARLDAILNDKRFLAKNEINEYTKSLVKEQKSYEGLYTTD